MSPHRPRGPVCSVGSPGSSLGPGTISQKQRPDHLERGRRREEMRFSLRPCGSEALPHLDRLTERSFSSSSAFSWAGNPRRACATSGEGSLRGGPPCIPVPWDPGLTALAGRASGPSMHRLLDPWASGTVGGRGVARWPSATPGDGAGAGAADAAHTRGRGGVRGGWFHGGCLPRPDVRGLCRGSSVTPVPPPLSRPARGRLRRVSSPRREPGRGCSVRWRDRCVLWCSGGCSWAAL